ncbi:MAG: hypothetical protein EXR86_06190 [Gammaproteobacteria bacterium]|nr:hypothetical protein [Gammaproteobacteria bacterium]
MLTVHLPAVRVPFRVGAWTGLFIALALTWRGASAGTDVAGPWPARLHEFQLDKLPASYIYEDVQIEVTAGEPVEDLAASTEAPSARHVEFQIIDLRSGRDYLFAAEAIGAAVLVSKELLPEIEVWSPAGSEHYARCVFRKVSRQYCCTQQDTFEAEIGGSSNALTLPGAARLLRHIGARTNECE